MTRYELQKKLHVSQDKKNKVDTAIQDCVFMAEKLFGKGITVPEVRYDLVGRSAGQAVYDRFGKSPHVVRINPVLLNENESYLVNQTVPHEMAHVVVHQFYLARGIKVKGHGNEWKRVMRHFGLEASRCHSLDTTTIRAIRGGTEFHFNCDCVGKVYKLSTNKYRKYVAGVRYQCPQCKVQLKFDKSVEL